MKKNNFFLYKKRPLVRKGKTIYYGHMYEKAVAMLTVKSEHMFGKLKISDDVQIQLISTNPETSPKDLVLKNSLKKGLFEALDLAGVWIDRYAKTSAV